MKSKAALIIIVFTFVMTAVSFGLGAIPETIDEDAPMTRAQSWLLILGITFFAVIVTIAVISSARTAKQVSKIAEQNLRLEELNEVTRLQKDEIMEAHKRTQLMMDSTPICSMLWDRDGNIIDCNEESVKTFGMRNKKEFIERFYELSPEFQSEGMPSKEISTAYISRAFRDGQITFDWMHQLPDGTPIPCEMTIVRVNYMGRNTVAAYARDLRDQKRMMHETLRLQRELETALQDARNANQAKTNFLASMSHEMRTPLNAVVGLTELMLNTGEVSQHTSVEDKLGKIHTSGMTLLGIVNDILDISKIESGKFQMNPIEYNTPSLINDIISLNIVRIGEKPIQFLLKIDENIPATLFGDDLRVKQVFNNLLSNAFKYTNAGTVEWSITFEENDNDIWLVSKVRDTGIGVKQPDIPLLFQDYQQIDAQANRKTEGTGLGLPITKRLVEMMDGTIVVDSVYGKGTIFTVRLRQQFVSDIPIGKEVVQNLMNAHYADERRAQSAKLKRIDLSHARVLVVDDMPTNLDVAKGMLMPYGIQVDCASGGQQAIDFIKIENPKYDLVFMDHMMPGMDGIEAVRIIREEIGTDYAKTVPIIALTANAIIGNEEMFLKRGFQAFISKPINMIRLDSILKQWIKKKARARENFTETLKPPAGGIDIDGIDTAAGMERFGGNEEIFINVLRSYAVNTRPLLGMMGHYLAEKNLNDYAITIHGIKGTSLGICAVNAGKEAEWLEKLASAGDPAQVSAAHGPFITHMESLIGSIDAAIEAAAKKKAKPAAAEPDQGLLRELSEACGKYNIDEVDRVMLQLESFEYESGAELVAQLRAQVDKMDYSEISKGGMYEIEN